MGCVPLAECHWPDEDRLCQRLTIEQRTLLRRLGQQTAHIVYVPGRGWHFGVGLAVGERVPLTDVASLAVRGLIFVTPSELLPGYSISALGRHVVNCMRSRGVA